MPDEANILAKLSSWLYGSLTHATSILERAFESDVVAVRVFGVKDRRYSWFVDAKLKMSHAQDKAVQLWPGLSGSLFEFIRQSRRTPGVYRPVELFETLSVPQTGDQVGQSNWVDVKTDIKTGAKTEAKTDPLQLQASLKPDQWYTGLLDVLGGPEEPSDCLCMELPVHEEIWAAVVLIRTKNIHPFTPRERQKLERIRPALERVIQSAASRQGVIAMDEHETPNNSTLPARPKRMATEQMLAKLTRTEYKVLGYLRQAVTEREIAQQVHRSPHTVHVHVKNIYRKLGVSSRGQLKALFGDIAKLPSTAQPSALVLVGNKKDDSCE